MVMAGSVLCLRHSGTRQGLSSSSGLLQPPKFPTAPPAFPHANLQHQLGIDQERRYLSMVGLRDWKEGEKLGGRSLRKEKRRPTYQPWWAQARLAGPANAGEMWNTSRDGSAQQDVPTSRSNLPSSTCRTSPIASPRAESSSSSPKPK